MRLINIHTLEFQRFTGSDIPKYAVASHRWGEHEAAYKDVLKRRNTDSAGYRKVEAFCEFVKKWDESIQWLWIDTCCIDKKSSAEESEAINSMYQYYSRAEVCVAFLADVWPMAVGEDAVGEEEVMREFDDSVWFTRGWTLQELLAPTTVLFTTSAWEVIGYKTQTSSNGEVVAHGPKFGRPLNGTISAITGIPEYILWDFPRSRTLSVPERMAWMDRRTTTRVEDMAYCLLGIFGVHMALIYGEGEGAMARLEEEVRKRENSSVSGSAWGDDTRSAIGERRPTESNWGDDTRSVALSMSGPRRAATSTWGDDSKAVAQAPALSAVAENEPSSPSPIPPPRSMTMGTARSLKDLRREYKENKKRIRGDGKSVVGDGQSVANGAPTREAPPVPGAPPVPPLPSVARASTGLNERVNAWRESTADPTPSVADEDNYQDNSDTETVMTAWTGAPSETLTNFSSATRVPGQQNGNLAGGTMQDLSDALPPPPPYPGQPPGRSYSDPTQEEPAMGVARSQTYTPMMGDTRMDNGRPPPRQNRLLQRIAEDRARRNKIRHGSHDNETGVVLPNEEIGFQSYPDDAESIAPSESASQLGDGPPSATSRSFLKRLAEERERSRSQPKSPQESESSSSQGMSRSQTFANTLTSVGSEITSAGGRKKLIKQLLNDERNALKEARKAIRRGK